MQISIIRTDNEELDELVRDINNRFDQIAREFNSFEVTISEEPSNAVENGSERLDTVYVPILGRFIRLGRLTTANAPNSCLFEDPADNKLRYKDGNGTVTVLT